MTAVFVSGSRGTRRLDEKAQGRLRNLIAKKYRILIGDASGIDRVVQEFLDSEGYRDVTVYCSGNVCRNNAGKWNIQEVAVAADVKGRNFYTAKDVRMAEDADYGLMIWDGKSPGTLKNILELLKRQKKSLVYFCPDGNFFKISDPIHLQTLLDKCRPEDVEAMNRKVSLHDQLKQVKPAQHQLTY